MPPKVLAKTHDRAGGVLPVSGAARAPPTKSTNTARLKLEIRRLPPGLTLGEFEEILGQEWKLGNRKVDWREYRQGKFKQAIGKVPEQSRCYIHLTSEALVKDFEARFLQVVFHDKAGTHKSPDLRHLPPTLGFAPNQRMALNVKTRADTRQGTIDQDPEFIRFLEAETQPISKPAALDTVGAEKEKVERVGATSTPLIEAIREKKANKAKAAAAKEEKRDGKSHAKAESKEVPVVEKPSKEARSAAPPQKIETAAKEPAKAVNKHVAGKQQQQQQRPASPQQPASTKGQPSPAKSKRSAPNAKGQGAAATQPAASSAASTTSTTATAQTTSSTTPAAPRQRQKGNPEGLKKLFQKDLGIKPKPVAAVKETTPAAPKPKPDTPTTASTATKAKESAHPPASKAQSNSKASAAAKSENQSAASASSSSHKAYLKHANPSQGMTEILIQQALSQFGDVVSVTIDPRKGTAIALFMDAQGLQKAREAKRVTVASGNVEVHEFKDRSAGSGGGSGSRAGHRPNRNAGRGGGGGGAGKSGAAATSAASTAAAGDAPKTST
ncbi:uncharacterized protein K489DRAFT_381550 [Dissoconium aciculare CBS 342.82]|uniref:UPF3 domain-containing protein n=1 Tax=Dissoconium aciculare CBS 342.82 TaxID=1314786 RepID=A0A6J3M0J8_9PEZI|nr:uncharacterized protein K489DRAFT_381550 [Dissoconium aciculare CBS 342.82]KAF1821555.1 hypothetical protein K489DRAFT_381550 [Dissoconium aciculare CBS 342.82]